MSDELQQKYSISSCKNELIFGNLYSPVYAKVCLIFADCCCFHVNGRRIRKQVVSASIAVYMCLMDRLKVINEQLHEIGVFYGSKILIIDSNNNINFLLSRTVDCDKWLLSVTCERNRWSRTIKHIHHIV